jgi:signal transduction histidine kinase
MHTPLSLSSDSVTPSAAAARQTSDNSEDVTPSVGAAQQTPGNSEDLWMRRALEVARAVMTELDLAAVLDRVLLAAREITGARYAALGILNEQRTELEQFLTSGVDEETHRAIGDLPRGRGVLGALIDHPQPLRVVDVGQHPSSYGFPAGHPVMRGFLGVPIVIRGEVWGNLYLTEKQDSEFTERDEEAATMLADSAAIAIDHAQVHEISERRRDQAEKAVRGLEATRDVVTAIGGEIALEHVLELIVKRGRVLVGAKSVVIMLRDGEELVVQASAGHVEETRGVRLPIAGSTSGQVLEQRRPERITDVAARLRIAPSEFGVPDAQTALLVPMVYRSEAVGVLAAFDRDSGVFSEDDEQMLRTFAASAATAVALAQSVQADRLRSSLAAADAERRRWARELHDETLQSLGGLRIRLSSALRRDDLPIAQTAMREALGEIEREIGNLRAIITELRPAALDELGLRAAIEGLIDRHRGHSGFQIDGELLLPGPSAGERLEEELESAVYRVVQEALTNVAKHAHASRVRVAVSESNGELLIEVRDNGSGFVAETTTQGFGLEGMKERASLAGGTLSVDSDGQGTSVNARLPARRRAIAGSDVTASTEQAVS